jgi:hypothetical protein
MEALRTYHPVDGGPIYAETPPHLHPGQWLIEPWNAVSSLLIVLPGLFFLYRLRGYYRQEVLLTACAVLLILGGMGSTLFHGLRVSRWFLSLDVLPTLLVFVLITLHLWVRAVGNWVLAVALVLAEFGLSAFVYTQLKGSYAINLAYFIRGTAFFLPLVILLYRTRFRQSVLVLGGLLSFVLALWFRTADKDMTHILEMGTHFLWHSATGIGGLLLAEYLFRVRATSDETIPVRSA